LYFLETPSIEVKPDFKVIVSKKVEKKAVNRNKIRRFVKEAYRKSDFFKNFNLNTLIFVKSKECAVDFVETIKDFDFLSKKLG